MTREEFISKGKKGYVTLRISKHSLPGATGNDHTPDTKYKVVDIREDNVVIEVKGGWLDSQYGDKGYWYIPYHRIDEVFPSNSYALGGEE